MRASQPAQSTTPIDDEMIAAYLGNNPDFFKQHPEILEELDLPHQSGNAVSLVQRQVSVLRDRNIEMRSRLGKLVDNARENDRLFELTRRLVLDLLLADSLQGVGEALNKSLQGDFKTDFSSLCLLTDTNQDNYGENFRCVKPADAKDSVGNLLEAQQVICGILRKEETAFLFPESVGNVKSAAVVPIGLSDKKIALLAIGSKDPQHYKSGMGTLFLSYIGEILAHALPKYL